MSHRGIVFLFVFCNYFNPFSIYLTLIVNLGLVLFVLFTNDETTLRIDPFVVGLTLVIMAWAILVMMGRSSMNTYVLGKYARVTVSTFVIVVLSNGLRTSARQLVPVLNAVFCLHVLFIGLQSVFPQLDVPMARFFGFERGVEIIEEMSIRKLGCTSSYDTAAIVSIAAMVLFFVQYAVTKKSVFLILSFCSMLSCTRTSRTGMVVGVLVFAALFMFLWFSQRGRIGFAPVLFLLGGVTLLVNSILPILASSTVSFLADTKYNTAAVSASDYSTGSAGALMNRHLDALDVPLPDLLLGLGVDPNDIPGTNSDIGYVRLVYHVGIVGTTLILLLYLYVVRRAVIIRRKSETTSPEFVLSSFLIAFALLVMVLNYKGLEVYSRGSHDLLLIMFCVVTNRYRPSWRVSDPSKRERMAPYRR